MRWLLLFYLSFAASELVKAKDRRYDIVVSPAFGNCTWVDNGEYEAWKIWAYRDVNNALVQLKVVNNNLGITLFDQRFDACKILRAKSMIGGLVETLRNRININLSCPIKKGYIEIKDLALPTNLIASLTPKVAGTSASRSIFSPQARRSFMQEAMSQNITFNFTVILRSKIKKQFVEMLMFYKDWIRV